MSDSRLLDVASVINHERKLGLRTFSSAKFVVLLALLTQLLGCTTGRLIPPPPQSELMTVQFSDKKLSALFDMPIGVHQIADSQVILSGHQDTRSVESILGPAGFDLEARMDSKVGQALTTNLTQPAKQIAREMITGPVLSQRYTNVPSEDAPYLDVRSAVILTLHDAALIKPYIVLHAALKFGGTNFIQWQGRYIASSGPARPITGDASWLSDGGKALNASISSSLKKAIEVMMHDVASPYPRPADRLIAVKGYYPYLNSPVQTVAYPLHEDDNDLVFLPKLSDAIIFAGVNVVDKQTVDIRPAKAEDEVYQVINSETPGQAEAPTAK